MGGGDLVSISHFVYNIVVLRCLKTVIIKLALNNSGFKDVSLLLQLSVAATTQARCYGPLFVLAVFSLTWVILMYLLHVNVWLIIVTTLA